MANVIRLKRASGSDPTASDLVSGEPAVRTDTGELFFKKDDGSVAKVSGAGGGPDFKYLALRNAANNGAASYPANDFTLVTSGTTTAITPAAANTLLVSVNGVIQKPNTGTSTPSQGFALSGSTIKFGANLSAAPDFILYQESGGIGEPSDETVSEEKLKVSNSPVNGYFLSAQSGNTGGLTWAAPVATSCTGNSATATALATARTINGTSFDGTANITVTAAAGTLTGNTLNSSVTASSLTSLGDLSGLTVTGNLAVDTNTLFVNASTNRVGMGTTSPTTDFDVIRSNSSLTDVMLVKGNSANAFIRFQDDDSSCNFTLGADAGSGLGDNSFILYDRVNSAYRWSIDNSGKMKVWTGDVEVTTGNVGIGTSSPSGKLDIVTGANGGNVLIDAESSSGYHAKIVNDSGDLTLGSRNTSGDTKVTSQRTLIFNSGSSETERMRIDSSGRVLIGTTTEGHAQADNLTIADSADSGLTIRSGTGSQGAIFFSDATSGDGEYDGFVTYGQGSSELRFGTARATRLKISSSGHVLPAADSTYNIGSSSVRFANGYFDTLYGDGSNLTGLNVAISTLNNASDNRILTSSGGSTVNAESGLTYDGTTLSNDAVTRNIKSGANYVLIGSSNAGGVSLGLDGDSNGDGAGADYAFFEHDTSGNLNIVADNPANASNIIFKTNSSTERLRIASTGMLEMRSDMSASDQASRNIFRFTDTDTSTTSNQSMGRLQWFSSDASGGGACVKAEIEAVANDTTPEANLIFKTHTSSATSPSERMRITGDGNVGINSTNPTEQLEINLGADKIVQFTGGIGQIGDVAGVFAVNTAKTEIADFGIMGNSLRFASGTALGGAERMRIDANGNVGMGTSSPASYDGSVNNLVVQGSGNTGITVATTNTSSNTALVFADGTGDADSRFRGAVQYLHNGDVLRFLTGSAERARLTESGGLAVGTTNSSPGQGNGNTDVGAAVNSTGRFICNSSGSFSSFGRNDTGLVLSFTRQGGDQGGISVSVGAVSYGSGSDYRLKENVVSLTGAITRIKQLLPKRFNFIEDTTNTLRDGFLAHEVSSIVPEAITGTKDEVDSDNNPVYQQIDQAKLVPLLVAAVQELTAKVEALEAK